MESGGGGRELPMACGRAKFSAWIERGCDITSPRRAKKLLNSENVKVKWGACFEVRVWCKGDGMGSSRKLKFEVRASRRPRRSAKMHV
jgi:hypothetical protein